MKVATLPHRNMLTRKEEEVVYWKGASNCFVVKFKSVVQIAKAMKKEYPDEGLLGKEYINVYKRMAGKAKVAHAFGRGAWLTGKDEFVSDIFVEGDNNICFNSDCFE